jgi:hypothetical protein
MLPDDSASVESESASGLPFFIRQMIICARPAGACEPAYQSRSRIGYAEGFTTDRIRRTKV